MKMTYRQLVDYLKQRQRLRLRRMTKPDDEWWPEAHFALADELRTIAIDPVYFEDRLSKRLLVDKVIVPAIHAGRVRLFGLQLVTYAISSANPDPVAQDVMGRAEYDPVGLPNFEAIPGRVEFLLVAVWDAERAEIWTATIDRPASGPPALGPWEMAAIDTLGGPMFDPIEAALR